MSTPQPLQVLIVQDGSGSAQMAMQALTEAGMQVRIADSGSEALDMLAQSSPHLVILDLASPERDGWETLVAMRSNPATAHIPVVSLSAEADDGASAVHASSLDGYLSSPVQGESFVREVIELAIP